MARLPRLVLPGVAGTSSNAAMTGEHASPMTRTICTTAKQLGEAARKHRCALHAYVSMTDHAHRPGAPQA